MSKYTSEIHADDKAKEYAKNTYFYLMGKLGNVAGLANLYRERGIATCDRLDANGQSIGQFQMLGISARGGTTQHKLVATGKWAVIWALSTEGARQTQIMLEFGKDENGTICVLRTKIFNLTNPEIGDSEAIDFISLILEPLNIPTLEERERLLKAILAFDSKKEGQLTITHPRWLRREAKLKTIFTVFKTVCYDKKDWGLPAQQERLLLVLKNFAEIALVNDQVDQAINSINVETPEILEEISQEVK